MQSSLSRAQQQQRRVQRHAERADAVTLFNLLTGPQLLERVDAALPEHRERLYPPTETLSMFVTQVLSADGSCQQAVDAAQVRRLISGLTPGSTDTGAYCRARARLPLELIATLTRECGGVLAKEAPPWWQWRGRRVLLVDGATTTLADTDENQARFPQPGSQKLGLGFPIARMVALMCLGSGALRDAAIAPCLGKGNDEQSLLREILDTVEAGDILLGDAFYATYFLLWDLIRNGVDGVFEQYGARKRTTDFGTGEVLGVRDHLTTWPKPKKRPQWMSTFEYERVPQTLRVRELQVSGKILVTTFLDPKATPKRVLKALYRQRWQVELDLRNIKTTLGMEQLRCKTPEMALKELWTYLLAYNLIRLLMAQSALLADQIPRQLSFKHTVQLWLAWQTQGGGRTDGVGMQRLLILIAQPRVGWRSGRIEPRAVKRRPKQFGLLMAPRDQARERVRVHGHPKKQR